MENKTEKAVAEVIEQPAKVEKQSKRGNGLAVFFSILALLIAVLAAAASAYLWQLETQRQQQNQNIASDISAAMQRVDQQTSASSELQRQVDQQGSNIALQQRQLQQQLQQLQGQLHSQQKQLHSLSTTDRDDWLLAEAEYLMRLANQRLLMGKEVKGALELLKAADDIVKELDDSALFSVREALADNMAALAVASKLDVEGIYLQLGALAQQAKKLRLIEVPVYQPVATEAAIEQTMPQRLQSSLVNAWQRLGSYIQIKRHDEIYKPLLAPEYEAAVRQNVNVMFEQAQLAALSGKQKIYQDSLAKARHWLTNYYTLDKSVTENMVARIDELSQQAVAVELPDISSSLRALKNYVATIHQVVSISSLKKTAEQAKQQADDHQQLPDDAKKSGLEDTAQ